MSADLVSMAIALTCAGALLFVRPFRGRVEHVTGIPFQIYRIATDPRLRRNHALEHATLNVLESRYGRPELNGVAVQVGFVLRGWVDPGRIASAAEEGLQRLQAGERSLAFHPRCGTSLGTAELITWVTLVTLLLFTGRLSWVTLVFGLAIAYVAAPWVGRVVQRRLTTATDLDGVEIAGVTVRGLPLPRRGAKNAGEPNRIWGEVIVLVRHPDNGRTASDAAGGDFLAR